MQKILLGQKLGMTQTWDSKGRLIAATVIFAEPNIVIKTGERTQIATATAGKTNKAQQHLLEKVSGSKGVFVKEVTGLETDADKIGVDQFTVGEEVKVSGVSKGKGFAGTIKRHNFHRGPVSHGSDNIRRPGSIGAQQPQRVPKGQKMAGHMGNVNVTVRGGKILQVDTEKNLLVVSGNIPGPARSQVIVKSI